MSIKGLTNQKPQFPQIGQLRKGEWLKEENRAIDLDYFRFTSDIPEVVEAFREAYGDEPRLINVYLPHPITDENWEAWYEEYLASGLIHRCDGEFVTRYRNQATGKYVDPEPGTLKCPYHSGEKERTSNRPGCQPNGRLQVVIIELKRFAHVMVITSSKNDIINLDGQLRALENINGKLTGIPLQLRRRPDRISTPKMEKRDGKWVQTTERQRRESWLLSIEASPDWASLEMKHQQLQATPGLPQLEAGWEVVEPEEESPAEESALSPEDMYGSADDLGEEPAPEPKPAMTLGEALGVPLNRDASKIGMKSGDYLLVAVRKDCKELFENLSKASAHNSPSFDNVRIQEASKVILANWDRAREAAMSEKEKEVMEPEQVEEMEVVEGEVAPLF